MKLELLGYEPSGKSEHWRILSFHYCLKALALKHGSRGQTSGSCIYILMPSRNNLRWEKIGINFIA